MIKKTYTARTAIMITVKVNEYTSATVTFLPNADGSSTFVTTSSALQEALESHSSYGSRYTLTETSDTGVAITEPKVTYNVRHEREMEIEVQDIEAKIPEEASAQNQLADKDYVNEGISTSSADFKGTFTSQQDMDAVTGNKNDYAYLVSQDATGNVRYNRYKWVEGTGWVYEYTIKQDDFSASEWAAIQSGITAALVEKLSALPNKAAIDAESVFQKNLAAIMALAADPNAATITKTTNPEWKLVYTDSDDKVLFEKKQDDNWYFYEDLDVILDAVIDGYTTV